MSPATSFRMARTATIATRVQDRAAHEGDRVAMREKRYGIWREIRWEEYWRTVVDVAHGLLTLGVEPGEPVAIHSENRPEWLYVDVATVAVRGVTTGLYPTNPAPEVRYLLADSGARVLFAEDQEQVDKALAVADDLPRLEHIVFVDPRGLRGYDDPRLLSWDDFLARGRAHRREHEGAVGRLMTESGAGDVATLIYTSGTTGPPKGSMLTVGNIEFAIRTLVEGGGFVDPPPSEDDVLLSYLPLCHVAERVFTTWFNVAVGTQVNFAESIDTVQENLAEIQPTIVFGVPRIWEKMKAGIEIRANKASPFKRFNYRLWMAAADRIGRTLVARGGRHTVGTRILYAVGWVVLYRALRQRVGLRLARYTASGAAPISPEVLRFFMGIGVPMHEVYGMTENVAIATANRPGNVRLGTVGEPHRGVEIRVDESTGEILTRHPGTFAGYWGRPEATGEVVDAEGWLHTGDVGEWVGDGGGRRGWPTPEAAHLKITDRMKDIIITTGGKNISPSEIENALKASAFIREAVVIGDQRKFLTALIGIELDTVGEWAQQRRLPYTTYRDLTVKDEVRRLVQAEVDRVNAAFAQVEQIKKFALLPKELDHEDGELTATQKVKRSAMAARFSDLVDAMYGEGATATPAARGKGA
jgi:long-chain acyl-CoA synthetase